MVQVALTSAAAPPEPLPGPPASPPPRPSTRGEHADSAEMPRTKSNRAERTERFARAALAERHGAIERSTSAQGTAIPVRCGAWLPHSRNLQETDAPSGPAFRHDP